MVDYFELLQEPRRPWLDPEQLKNKFLSISANLHPDRVHGSSSAEKESAQDRYTGLNTAYENLRQPKQRLAHLIELESGEKPPAIQSAPGELMDLFMRIGALCSEVDKFAAEKRSVTSPLVRVGLFARSQELTYKVTSLQKVLTGRTEEAERSLQSLNKAWENQVHGAGQLPLKELEELYRVFSYLSRWSAQLQERLVQLALAD